MHADAVPAPLPPVAARSHKCSCKRKEVMSPGSLPPLLRPTPYTLPPLLSIFLRHCVKENSLKIILHPDLHVTPVNQIRQRLLSGIFVSWIKSMLNEQITKEEKSHFDNMETRFSVSIRQVSIYLSVNSWVTHYYMLAFPIRLPHWASKPDIKELPLCACARVCFACVCVCSIIYSTPAGCDELVWPVTPPSE